MELVQRKPRNYHVSEDIVAEVESAILSDPRVQPAAVTPLTETAIWFFQRMLDRTIGDRPLALISRLSAKLGGEDSHSYFAVLMGLNVAKCAPYFIRPSRKSIYLFDAWPDVHDRILKFAHQWQIENIFVSSRQVATRLNDRSSSNKFTWIPEGIDPTQYQSRDYRAKDIEVLQLGRKYDVYHENIVRALNDAKKTYMFEAVKGIPIFPTRQSFVDGLSRTRISICFPSNLTHPNRAGDIETMTARYLQSMVSKCLVVGHAPAEMIQIFGYNPIIEAEMENAGSQLLTLLDNFDSYTPLIEKNYATVLQKHTWRARWNSMAQQLFR